MQVVHILHSNSILCTVSALTHVKRNSLCLQTNECHVPYCKQSTYYAVQFRKQLVQRKK